MELCIRDSGKEAIDMALEYRYGLMELSMKGIGRTTKLMARVSFGMQMGMYLTVNGEKIRQMVLVLIFM